MKKLSKKSVLLLGASGLLAAGIAVPAVASAAEVSPAPSASVSQATGRHGPDQQKLAAALAKELGIDEQRVTDALAKVHDQLRPENGEHGKPGGNDADHAARMKERLAQAVKDGKLTQAEADAITKAQEAGVLGGGHGPAR